MATLAFMRCLSLWPEPTPREPCREGLARKRPGPGPDQGQTRAGPSPRGAFDLSLDFKSTSSGNLHGTEHASQILFVGAGATLVTDLWSLIRRQWLGIPLPNYRLVGRWLGRMLHGEFRHETISKSPPVRAERFTGWLAHYLIGIVFAVLPLVAWGREWVERPQLGAALLVGVTTVAAPLLIMQPAMGVRRAPWQSLVTHAMFGLGLFVSAVLYRSLRG